jgi:WD40 repeat protein
LRHINLASVASYHLQDYHYFKGVKFSPDGRCILTSSDDRKLQLFEVPNTIHTNPTTATPLQPVLTFTESETIYDFAWYPRMNSSFPQTCVFASTSRNTPIHLFDAYTGQIRASYRAYDQYDDLSAALSLSFNIDGTRLYAGFARMVRVFDVSRPGKYVEERPTCKNRSDKDGQKGIVSCLDFNPDCSGLYAAGSYDRSVWVYDDRSGDAVLSYENAHRGGVTQVQWCPNGRTLCSGGRRDEEIVVWDVRGSTTGPLQTFHRNASTNQRFAFDISDSGRYLVTGSSNRRVDLHDLVMPVDVDEGGAGGEGGEAGDDKELQRRNKGKEHFCDAVNGVSLGKLNAKGLLVTCTGQRRPPMFNGQASSGEEEEEEEEEEDKEAARNCVELWTTEVE